MPFQNVDAAVVQMFAKGSVEASVCRATPGSQTKSCDFNGLRPLWGLQAVVHQSFYVPQGYDNIRLVLLLGLLRTHCRIPYGGQ